MKLFKILGCAAIAGILCSSLTGCVLFRNPLHLFEKQNSKVETLVGQVSTNSAKINSDLSGFVFSADATLRQSPIPDKYNLVARDFTTSALKVTGTPTPTEQIVYETTISNLLSDNKKLIEKGQKQVEQENRDVAGLLNQKESLQNKLDSANTKLEKISLSNSKLAEDWQRLKKWTFGIVIGFVVLFILKTLSSVLPIPYNSVGAIISIPISLLVKGLEAFFPEAIKICGFVSKDFEAALGDMVNVVESLKKISPEQHTVVTSTVLATVNDSSIAAINSVKTAAKIVS